MVCAPSSNINVPLDMFPALAVAGGTLPSLSHTHGLGESVLFIATQVRNLESVFFIGTEFSNLYTTVDTPAEAA